MLSCPIVRLSDVMKLFCAPRENDRVIDLGNRVCGWGANKKKRAYPPWNLFCGTGLLKGGGLKKEACPRGIQLELRRNARCE